MVAPSEGPSRDGVPFSGRCILRRVMGARSLSSDGHERINCQDTVPRVRSERRSERRSEPRGGYLSIVRHHDMNRKRNPVVSYRGMRRAGRVRRVDGAESALPRGCRNAGVRKPACWAFI